MARFHAIAAAALLLAGACARQGPVRMGVAPALEWPSPPDRARLRLVGRLPSTDDPLKLRRPLAVAVAPDGRVLVVEGSEAALHVFDLARGEHRVVRDHGGRRFVSPVGVAADGSGRAYVADAGAGLVAVVGPDLRLVRRFEHLERPTGLAIDRRLGRLFCVETGAHRVRILDLEGGEHGRIGAPGDGPGQLSYPTFAALTPEGRLLVSDSLNARVSLFEPDGRLVRQIGQPGGASGDLARPKGVAADRDGHVYVVDAVFDNLQVFDQDGALLLYLGEAGTGPGQLWLPSGLAFDDHDRLFVANTFGERVDVLQYLPDGEAKR